MVCLSKTKIATAKTQLQKTLKMYQFAYENNMYTVFLKNIVDKSMAICL